MLPSRRWGEPSRAAHWFPPAPRQPALALLWTSQAASGFSGHLSLLTLQMCLLGCLGNVGLGIRVSVSMKTQGRLGGWAAERLTSFSPKRPGTNVPWGWIQSYHLIEAVSCFTDSVLLLWMESQPAFVFCFCGFLPPSFPSSLLSSFLPPFLSPSFLLPPTSFSSFPLSLSLFSFKRKRLAYHPPQPTKSTASIFNIHWCVCTFLASVITQASSGWFIFWNNPETIVPST